MNSFFKTPLLQKIAASSFAILFFIVSFLPLAYSSFNSITGPEIVLAAEENEDEEEQEQEEEQDGGGGSGSSELMNPLKATDLISFLNNIIDVLLIFALPIIVFFIMYGGFKLVTAQGNSEQISEGRSAITWAVIGGVIVLGAKTIMTVIEGTVNAI